MIIVSLAKLRIGICYLKSIVSIKALVFPLKGKLIKSSARRLFLITFQGIDGNGGEFGIKVADTHVSFNFWIVRRLVLFIKQQRPIDSLVEWVLLDFLCVS